MLMRRNVNQILMVCVCTCLVHATLLQADEPRPQNRSVPVQTMSVKATSADLPDRRDCKRDRELETVPDLDLERYMGKWYEIARYDNRHQRGTVATTTEFRMRDDGKIDVLTTARKKHIHGKLKTTDAKGWIVDGGDNAKWKVQWFWLLRSDYWMIHVSDDYRHAVIGQPSRKNVWVISREPTMDQKTFDDICRIIARKGFDPGKLVMTPQLTEDRDANKRARLARK